MPLPCLEMGLLPALILDSCGIQGEEATPLLRGHS